MSYSSKPQVPEWTMQVGHLKVYFCERRSMHANCNLKDPLKKSLSHNVCLSTNYCMEWMVWLVLFPLPMSYFSVKSN